MFINKKTKLTIGKAIGAIVSITIILVPDGKISYLIIIKSQNIA
jgi:hypothetical protein